MRVRPHHHHKQFLLLTRRKAVDKPTIRAISLCIAPLLFVVLSSSPLPSLLAVSAFSTTPSRSSSNRHLILPLHQKQQLLQPFATSSHPFRSSRASPSTTPRIFLFSTSSSSSSEEDKGADNNNNKENFDDEPPSSSSVSLSSSKSKDQEEDSGGAVVVGDAVPMDQLYRALHAYRRIVIDKQQQEQPDKLGPTTKTSWEVPSNFFVPSLSPWPEEIQGLPLGQQVQSLKRRLSTASALSSGHSNRNNPVAWLEKFKQLGLASLAAAVSTTTTTVATTTTAPTTTTATPELAVPVGGTAVATASPFLNNAKETKASTGSSTDESDKNNGGPTAVHKNKVAANDVRFNNVYEALKMYKSIYGDLSVPQRFAVPRDSKEWPEETWGLRLGARVNAIRSRGIFVNNNPERRTMLDDLGFVFQLRIDATDIRFNNVYEALKMYRSICGDLLVPQLFAVPRKSKEWPEEMWGLRLGARVNVIRSKGTFVNNHPERRTMLDDLGFVWCILLKHRFRPRNDAHDIRFNNVYEALKTYKSIYGDLLVPQPFAVPHRSKDWPEETWGLRLGSRVNTIRSQGTFVKNNPERRAMLDDLGFVWPPKNRFRLVYEALKTYRSIYGDLLVPYTFAVPHKSKEWPQETWGLRLGNSVSAIRSKGTFVNNHPERRTMLDDLGFVWCILLKDRFRPRNDAHDIRFNNVYEALKTYRSIHGDLLVPQLFAVPCKSKEWPEEMWGLRLGTRVNAIRSQGIFVNNNPERRAMLDDLGFVWPQPDDCFWLRNRANDSRYNNVYEALKTYRSIYGDLFIPQSFAVPRKSKEWPEEMWGLRLGARVNVIRSKGIFVNNHPDRRTMLDDLGFVWSIVPEDRFRWNDANDIRFNNVYEALKMYRSIYGDLLVPQPFVVPRKSKKWPEEMWGLRLGSRVNTIRSQGTFVNSSPERRAMLDDLGFVFQLRNDAHDIRFNNVYEALKTYRSMYGDLLVPQLFAVPCKSKEWPEETWGLLLGSRVSAIRSQGTFVNSNPERRTMLNELGFVWSVLPKDRFRLRNEAYDIRFNNVYEALKTYRSIYGDLLVPPLFVVPRKSTEWPEEMWGLRLGSRVNAIQSQGQFVTNHPERRSMLDDLGFVWPTPNIRFNNVYEAMKTYKSVYGDLLVPPLFTVPYKSKEWTEEMWGLRLGARVHAIRLRGTFVNSNPERRTMLDDLGFVWSTSKDCFQ